MRSLSPSALASLNAQETSEAYLVLLDIDAGGTLFQFTSDSVDTTVDPLDAAPDSSTWDDSDTHWTDQGGNRFVYSRVGAQPSASVFSTDVSGLTHGVSYDVNVVFSNTVGTSAVRPYLGAGFNNTDDIDVADGAHTLAVTYDDTAPNITFETLPGLDTASFTMQLVSIRPTGSAPPEVYQSFPFDITLPKTVDDQISTATLSVTNVDRRMVDAIRTVTDPITVKIQVVLGSDPNDIMVQYQDFTWRELTYDAATISGKLTLEDFLNEPVGKIMGANNFPGLFYQ